MSASTQSNDLRNRILFTIFILAVYRFGTFVPLPGIDPEQLRILMEVLKKLSAIDNTKILLIKKDKL